MIKCLNGHEYITGSYWLTPKGHHRCKLCAQNYRLKNRESINKRHREWRKKTGATVKSLDEARIRSFSQDSIRYGRDRHLRSNYGLSIEEYDKLWIDQLGLCAICGGKETYKSHGQVHDLSVDHNHKTGHIRGLLCRKCNIALGGFKDNKNLLKRAVAHLENW